MAFKIAKCPACGADLNIETDKDYLFCQFCGAKLIKDDQKITIEHIERKIDEAEIERTKLEREKSAYDRVSSAKMGKICGILTIVGLVFSFIGYSGSGDSAFGIVGIFMLAIAFMLFGVLNSKNN